MSASGGLSGGSKIAWDLDERKGHYIWILFHFKKSDKDISYTEESIHISMEIEVD